MAKYRCPVCGATHKQMPEHCRLCGQTMGEESIVGDFSGNRQDIAPKKGLSGIVLAVIGGVLVLVLVLVLLGLAPGARQVESVTRNIPGVPTNDSDGWSELADPEGGFVTRFPGGERQKQAGVAVPSFSGTGTKWSVNLGDETVVFVTYVPADPEDRPGTAADETGTTLSGKARVNRIAEDYVEALEAQGAKVDKKEEVGVGGYPAVYLEVRNVKDPTIPGKSFYDRILLIGREDTVYLVGTQSIYKDATQFDKLSSSFTLTERGTTGSTVTP
jgi:hypothetical protein